MPSAAALPDPAALPAALAPAGAGAPVRPVIPGPAALPCPPGRVRPVVLYPDPVLRTRCRPAGELKFPELEALVADLFATLYAAGGRGLAAPQIGVARRVFVMDPGWKDGTPAPLAVIEPALTPAGRRTAEAEELCLSIPGRPVRVRRPARVRMDFFDLAGVAQSLPLDGMAARIAQHEADHLDGVLILDPRPEAASAAPPAAPARRRRAAAGASTGA